MTINKPTVLTVGGSGTDGTVYTTPSVTVQPNAYVLVLISNAASAAGNNVVPVVTGLGLSWTTIVDGVNASNNLRGTFLWAKAGAGGASGVITVTFSTTQSSCQWHVIEATHVHATSPIVTSGSLASTTPDDPAVVLATPSAGSASFGAMVWNSSVMHPPGDGFTALSESPSATSPTIISGVEYRADAKTSVGWTTTANLEKILLAFELRTNPADKYILLENGNKLLLESGTSALVN